MILDAQNLFSNAQSLVGAAGTTNSTNVIDTLVTPLHGIGGSGKLEIEALVMTTFAGGTSVQFQLVSADDSGLATNLTVHQASNVVPEASLTAGSSHFKARVFEGQVRRYVAMQYITVGTHTAGSVTTGLNLDRQEFNAYASGLNTAGY